jgi:UDP-N-acetyl-D-galactosamine dehydrogenase
MAAFVGQKLVKLMIQQQIQVKKARVGIFGLTFKEDVRDIRNSKVPDIVHELNQFAVYPLIHDPFADPDETLREYGLTLSPLEDLRDLDAVIYAVNHSQFLDRGLDMVLGCLKPTGVLVDVKSAFASSRCPPGIAYWSL